MNVLAQLQQFHDAAQYRCAPGCNPYYEGQVDAYSAAIILVKANLRSMEKLVMDTLSTKGEYHSRSFRPTDPESEDPYATEKTKKPTFDEWFEQKHGASFEQLHMQHGAFISDSMVELSKQMRDYVTELVQNDL